MKSIKNFFAVTLGIMGAIILAPFVAFFGLLMLGLAFGLSLIAAGAVASFARNAETEAARADDASETEMGAKPQPA